MKKLTIVVIGLFYALIIFAQPTLHGVLLKKRLGYSKGDTICLSGYYPSNSSFPANFVVKSKNGVYRLLNCQNIRVIDSISDFWDNKWYFNRSGTITKNGYDNRVRHDLANAGTDYLSYLNSNNILFNDSSLIYFLEDEINYLGPEHLYKGSRCNLKINVIKAEVPDIFSYDDGNIFITTTKLAFIKDREELDRLLLKEIAHIELDHQAINRRNYINEKTAGAIFLGLATAAAIIATNSIPDNHFSYPRYESTMLLAQVCVESCINFMPLLLTYTPPKERPQYSDTQESEADNIADEYLRYFPVNNNDPNFDLTANLAPAITQTSWDFFFLEKYKEALELVNRLEEKNMAISDDYLLKAKLYRKLYHTDESCYEALKYLNLAKKTSTNTNIDILKEEGLIYYRLKDLPNARKDFEEYRDAILELGVRNDNDNKELNWAKDMIQKTIDNN